ncbi:hypothetical protein B5C34_12175 [Pacificimonas flava]|uniref:Uncharacterized protein n=2 Tax=Pacificimonas TaxID=1960290 RepID=A0A219B7L4_9SPHN|nr:MULTISPECIES: hypothetical protein [Pacificimonas]MBZ6378578.1 hypothetical protein [Pacificimonas aurantium]OWV34143.1 hypothetical protein B5C34_12175 [Pacificimonas flava]
MNLMQALLWTKLAELPEIFDDDYVSFPRALFHPKGLRIFLSNWEDLAESFIQVIHRMRLNRPEIGEKIYEVILSLTDLPDSWRALNDDRLVGTVGHPFRAVTGSEALNLRFMTFEVGTPPEQPDNKFPNFLVNVNVPEDEASERRLAQIWEKAKVENIHERLRPALIPFEESPPISLGISETAQEQLSHAGP